MPSYDLANDLPDNTPAPGTMPGNGTVSDGSTDSGMPSWLKAILPPSLGGTGGSAGNLQYLLPALATAYNQYQNSDRYMDIAKSMTGILDPFQSQRGQYQGELSQLMNDPNAALKNDPAFQSMQNLGLGALNRGNMTKQGGVTNADDIAYSQQLMAQYIPQREQQLAQLSGAQFGPGAAASLLQTGMQGSINSRNAALQAAMFPFGGQANPGANGNPANTVAPGGMPKTGGTPSVTSGGSTPPNFAIPGSGGGANGDGGSGVDVGTDPYGTTGGSGGYDGSWFTGGDGNMYQFNDTLGN